MVYRSVYNTSDQPVTVDAQGHTIGGREWGTVQTTEDRADRLIGNRTLVFVADPPAGVRIDSRLTDVIERTKNFHERDSKVNAADKEVLVDLAIECGLLDESAREEPPHKADVVKLIVTSECDISDLKARSKKAAEARAEADKNAEQKQEAN